MSQEKVYLPVKAKDGEGFQLVEKSKDDLTVKDYRYLEHTKDLKEGPEGEQILKNALMEYFADEGQPVDADAEWFIVEGTQIHEA